MMREFYSPEFLVGGLDEEQSETIHELAALPEDLYESRCMAAALAGKLGISSGEADQRVKRLVPTALDVLIAVVRKD